MADEKVINDPTRRLLTNLIKAINYNCEKDMQEHLIKYHDKRNETSAIIIQLIQQPGKIKFDQNKIEVDRIPTEYHTKSCDKLIDDLNLAGNFKTHFALPITIRQAKKSIPLPS